MAVVPLKKFFSVNRIIIGLFVFLSLYSGMLYAFATTYVSPGATLDPSGLPGDYTVGPLLSYGEAITTGHDNEVLYVDGNGDLASDDGFYRNSITKDTYILQPQSGGLDIGGIAVGEDILGVPGTDGAVFRRGTAVHRPGASGLWCLPCLHHDDGRYARRCAARRSRGAVDRGRRDACHRRRRFPAAEHRALADRRHRGCRPVDRGRRQRPAEGGGGAPAVDGVPVVRAVGGP